MGGASRKDTALFTSQCRWCCQKFKVRRLKEQIKSWTVAETNTSSSIFDHFGQICQLQYKVITPELPGSARRRICLKDCLNAWFCYNALHQEDRWDVNIKLWTSVLLLMPSGRIGIWRVFFIYPGHSEEGRQNWKEAGRGGGGGERKSDINLLCPLTLQRLAVNQSKPSPFQKALFDHAG